MFIRVIQCLNKGVNFSPTSWDPQIILRRLIWLKKQIYAEEHTKVLFKWMNVLDKADKSFELDIVKSEVWQRRLFWLFSYVGCDFPLECHGCLNSKLITLSLMGMSSLDRQPRLEYLKCLICVSSEKAGDPCSSSLSFRVLSLEAACSCPRLFTAGGTHTGRRGAKPSVFEQQVVIQSCCLLYVPSQ